MTDIAFKILHINRNEKERNEFAELLNYQTKCFDEFSLAKTNESTDFLMENVKKYQELLGVENIEINLADIENPFDILINGANKFFNSTDCNKSISEIVAIVIYYLSDPIGFIFVWNHNEYYAVQHIQNLIPYYIANSVVNKKINFATIVFEYVYEYIKMNQGKILCVRPINKMIQFVEKNKFVKLLLINQNHFTDNEREIFGCCEFLYKYPFRNNKDFIENPDTNIVVDYIYYKILKFC
jgi:hypothetical protein